MAEEALWAQGGNYDAVEDRKLIAGIYANEGVIWGLTPSVTGTNTISVSTGQAVADDHTGGMFLINNGTATANITVSTSAGTYLVYAVIDSAVTGGSNISYAVGTAIPNYAVKVGEAVRNAAGSLSANSNRTQAELRTTASRFMRIDSGASNAVASTNTFSGTQTFNGVVQLNAGFEIGAGNVVQKRFALRVERATTSNTSFSIPNNTWTVVPYNVGNEVVNDYGTTTSWRTSTWTATAGNGQVKVPVTGYYHVASSCAFADDGATSGWRGICIARTRGGIGANFLQQMHGVIRRPGSSINHAGGVHTCATIYAQAGDTIESWVKQTAGSDIGIYDGQGIYSAKNYDDSAATDGHYVNEMSVVLVWVAA